MRLTMPFGNSEFSSAVSFTMLHHVPSPELQDQVLREVCRVLKPGGFFVGNDSLQNWWMRIIHVGDTLVPVNPKSFGSRLHHAGFEVLEMQRNSEVFRFRARRPIADQQDWNSKESKAQPMTRDANLMSGITRIVVPTIQYGGYFLLTSLINRSSGYMENTLRQNFFRAGHAHAGVIVLLSLICQLLADSAMLPIPLLWFVRIGVPFSAVLISAGCFFSVLSPTAIHPDGAACLIYLGAVVLAVAVVLLGIGLLKAV